MTAPGPLADETSVERSIAVELGSAREARWIVEHAGGDDELALDLAARRAGGEPLQYVLGRWPFRTLELTVDRRVLIPRPETEHVVEVALAGLMAPGFGPIPGPAPGRTGSGPVCVDLGTGSGAIALSLAVEGGAPVPGARGVGHRSLAPGAGRGAGKRDRAGWPRPGCGLPVASVRGPVVRGASRRPGRPGGPDGVQSPLRRRGRLPRPRPRGA